MSSVFKPEEIQFMRDNAKGRKYAELTYMLNHAFGTSYRANQVKCACYDRGISNGLPIGAFHKGHKLGIGNKWGFSCGNKPHNFHPAGTEIEGLDGYVRVKTSDNPPVWRYKHKLLWEHLHGEIPKGHNVVFADGNRKNLSPDNLILVSNSELCVMNTKGYIFDDADLTKAGHAVAKVVVKIHEKMV